MTQHGDAELVTRLCKGWPPMHVPYAAAGSGEAAP